MLRTLFLTILTAFLVGCGISGNLRHHPGFAAFAQPAGPAINRVTAISLGPIPLTLARMFVDGEERAMLKGIKGVRVYVYEVGDDRNDVPGQIQAMADELAQKGWDPMISVREDGELVRALAHIRSPERIDGLAVLIGERDEIVLVNLIGDLRPERFNDYMRDYDIDTPVVSIGHPEQKQLAVQASL